MDKILITQDTLYKFLINHDVKLVRLAELSGMSETSIHVCFKHYPLPSGQPRLFTRQALELLNEALEVMAEDLRGCLLQFGTEQVFTNQRGNTYDPGLLEPMKRIGKYLNLTAVVNRVLGWNKRKKENILVTPSSKVYGCISREDAERINEELLLVSGAMMSYELVSESGDSSPSDDSERLSGQSIRSLSDS